MRSNKFFFEELVKLPDYIIDKGIDKVSISKKNCILVMSVMGRIEKMLKKRLLEYSISYFIF